MSISDKLDCFNMSISDKLDCFNCYLAGRSKAEAAIKIAQHVAANPELHHHIPIRDTVKGTRTLFHFPADCSSAKDMYEKGTCMSRVTRCRRFRVLGINKKTRRGLW